MTVGKRSAAWWRVILVLLGAVYSVLAVRLAPAHAQDFVSQESGSVSLRQMDQSLWTPLGAVPISRTYTADAGAGGMGPGWTLAIVSSLDSPMDGLLAVTQAGHSVILTRQKEGKAYDGPGGVRLYRKGEGWVSESPDGATSTYDKQGRETARRDAHGNVIEFSYGADGRLAKIAATGDRFLTLRYGRSHLLEAIEGSSGERAEYRYDPAGRLVEAIDADGWKTSYGYTKEGRLSEIHYPSGEIVGLRYDSAGRVVKRTSSIGPVFTYSYGEWNRVTREDGFWSEVQYDARGQAVSYRDSLHREQSWTRDAAGRLTARRFLDGSSATYAYDTRGRLVKQETNRGDILKLTYEGDNSRPLVMDHNGLATRFSYDAFGDLLSVASPGGRKIAFSYDKQGRKTSVTDSEGRTVRFEYDQWGNLTKQINPDKGATSWRYDTRGNLLESRDPAGRTTHYTYNNRGQLSSVTEPGGVRTTYAFDPYGRLASETEGASTIKYTYDQKGRLTRIAHPDGTSATLTHDPLGNPIAFTDGLGRTVKRELDALGRPIKMILPTGVSATSVFDPSGKAVTLSVGKNLARLISEEGGKVIRMKDPAGSETSLTLGKRGEILEQVLPGGGVERRTYDADGFLQTVTLPQGDTWRFVFDRAGELGEIGYPDGSRQKRTYDQAGNLSAVVLPWGGQVQYRYDPSGLLVEKVNARGEGIRYTYDQAGNLIGKQTPTGKWNFQYDSRGNLLQASNGNFTVRHTYDNLSRLIETEYPEWRKLLRYQYDTYGRIVSRAEPDGRQTRYSYDTLGRVSRIANEKNEAITFAYDQYDRLTSRTAPNGTTTLYTYDDSGRITAIEHRNGAGTIIAARRYGYDVAGNRTEVVDEGGRKTAFRYDNEGRLISEQGPELEKTYLYGPGGNRSATSEVSGRTPYTYDKSGRLIQAGKTSFSYDADGNLISRTDRAGTTRYAYDSENNLIRAELPGGKVVSYSYGPFGERISRQEGGQIVYSLLDGNGILQELSGDHKTRAAYLYASLDQPLLMTLQDGSINTFHQDTVGNLLAVSDPKGELVRRCTYDAFGNVLQKEGKGLDQPLGFAGRPMDPDTGLYDLRARFYDPKTGRFITRDPAGGTPERPQTFAPYLYANNNPLKYVDPFGTEFYLTSGNGVMWYPSFYETLGQDPDAVLRELFDRPTSAYFTGKGPLDAFSEEEHSRNKARLFRRYIEVFRRTMGEDLAEDWRRRALPVWDSIHTLDNRANRPEWQQLRQKLLPAENAAATARIRIAPGGGAPAPQAADPLEVTGQMPVPGRAGGATFGNKLRGMAGLLGLSGAAQSAADWFGENFDIGTGQWSDGAAQDLKDRASRYLSWGTALTAVGSTAVSYALAETTAGAVLSTGLAGAAAAGVGLFTANRVSAMLDEAAGWRRAEDEKTANTSRAELADSMICNRAKEYQRQLLEKAGELDRLRPEVQRAADEIKNHDLEAGIGNKKNVILAAGEKLDALANAAKEKADAIRTLNPAAGTDPADQKIQALLNEIQELKNRACKTAEQIKTASDEDKRRKLTAEAQGFAGNADTKAKELGTLIGASTDAPKPSSGALSELEDIVLQMEEVHSSMSSDLGRVNEWMGVIDTQHKNLQQAWNLQWQLTTSAKYLQNFTHCFDQKFIGELPELRQRAEAPLPSRDQAASTYESAKANSSDARNYYQKRAARLPEAHSLLAGLKKERSSAGDRRTKNGSLDKANTLAKQARECAEAIKAGGISPTAGSTDDGFGPAGEGTTEETTSGVEPVERAEGDGFGPGGDGQTTDQDEEISLLGSNIGSAGDAPPLPGTSDQRQEAGREPSWSPPLSHGDQVGAQGQPVGPGDYRWYVMCNRTNGTVVFGKEWDPSRHVILAGPFEGPRTAQNWIGENCPTARCNAQGVCSAGAPPTATAGGNWYVMCNRHDGSVVYGQHPDVSRQFILAGPLPGPNDATGWIAANCPSARCTQTGACATAPVGGGSWYVLCNRDDGNVVMSRNVDPSRQIVWQGGFLGEWDARQWISLNCPSARCDRNGRCTQQAAPIPGPVKPQPAPSIDPRRPGGDPTDFCKEQYRRFQDALRNNQTRYANDILQASRGCWFYSEGTRALQQAQSKPPVQSKPQPAPAPGKPGPVITPTPAPTQPSPTCNRRAKCESWDAKGRRWVLSTGYGGGFGKEYEVVGACQGARQIRCWDECDKRWRCYETR